MPDYSDTRLQFRRGTFAEWAAANPILASGEPGYDITNKILKVGDGTTAFASLSGISGGGGGGGGGGATIFTDLLDTPANYTSSAGLLVKVNSAESAIEFGTVDIVTDTSPQLGGNLDLNSREITGTGDVDIAGTITANGTITGAAIVRAGGSSSQFLKADGSLDSNTYITSASALSNVVEDTTPQLGGGLDAQGNDITTVGNISATGNITSDADIDATGTITGTTLVKSGGTSSQFLKADGSVDSSTYLTSYTETDTLATVTGRGATTTTTSVIPFYYANQAAFPNATTYHGAIAHSHSDGAMYFAHGGSWNKLANSSDISNSSNWDTAYGWGDHSTAGYLTSIAGITISNFNAATIVTESEDIASNDNDTTLPTSAAVKDYIDTQLGGGGMYNLVEDTTPQLGGTLDTNSQDITGGIRADTIGIDLDSAITGGTPLQVYDLADTQPFFAVRAGSAFISAIFGPCSGSANNRIQYYSSNTTTGNYWRQDASETTYSLTRVDGGVADDTVFSIVNSGATFNENLDVQGDLTCSGSFTCNDAGSQFSKGLVINNDGTHINSAFQVKGGGSEPYLIQTNHSTNRVGIRTNAAAATLDVNGDVAVTGTFTVAGDVTLASTGVVANTPTFGAGLIVNKNVVVNDDGTNNSSLRVEGDTDVYLLYTDPANDRVGIGTSTPASLLDVDGTLTATTLVKSGGTSSQFLKADGSVDSSTYLTAETNDLSAAVTWANVPDANITQSSVTQHQAALSITESQISDLQSYLTSETFTSLVQDTTPQLGGALDVNGNNITGNGAISVSGDLTTHGNNVNIGSASYGLEVSSSAATLGSNRLQILSAETVMNQAGASVDFRVEGDTDTDLFFVDASADRVGISTSTPAQVLDVTTSQTEGFGINLEPSSTPASSGDYQSLITENRSDSIVVKHLENTSNGSSTLVFKNLIRYGADFVSIDDAYNAGLGVTYYPKFKVNTDTGAITFNDTYTFPTADGSADQVLKTDGAGNLSFGTLSTTNLDTTNFSAATIVTEAEGIGSNDNDTTLPTSAAVKDYADTKVASDTSAVTNSVAVDNIVMITQTNYDALSSYDANTLYFIIS